MKYFWLILVIGLGACSGGPDRYMKAYDWSRDSFPLADFVPLAIGNYWVYNVYVIDSTGNDSLLMIDTLSINESKMVNGREYFLLYENHGFGSGEPYSRYICDSSGYLVYDNGQIGFSSVNFTDTLRVIEDPGISRATYCMCKEPTIVSVDAGEYKCLNYEACVKFNENLEFWNHPSTYNNYYAPGIGKVKSTAFYVSRPYCLERRLVSYHIED